MSTDYNPTTDRRQCCPSNKWMLSVAKATNGRGNADIRCGCPDEAEVLPMGIGIVSLLPADKSR
eukprot:464463-Amphidinium_carterae.1